jgi:UDP-glucose:(heptosyl)LPS alpha-1,3-glucosyltransferase
MGSVLPDAVHRVAIVRARYSGHGGAERFVERAVAALGSRVELTIIGRRWDAPGIEQRPYRFEQIDPFYAGSLWRDLGFAQAVRAHVAQGAYDLVQSHERIAGLAVYRAGDGVHAAYLERRKQRPTAINLHHRWLLREERRMFEHSALKAVICNSQMVMREIQERFGLGASKLRLIRNGIDLEAFCPPAPEKRHEARMQLKIGPQHKVICLVGSGFARKGVDIAIRALHALNDSSAMLLVVGHDKHAGRFSGLARELGLASQVRFLGVLGDVRPVLHASDLMLLPALYDPFPNAGLEALACGLPVLTTTACGVGELLPRDQVLEAHDSPARWAQAVSALLEPVRCETLRVQARIQAQALGLPQMATQMLTLYRDLLRGP